MTTDIRDRIVDFRRVRSSDLLDNAGNWRTHPKAQRDALRGVLAEVGIAGALVAYCSERNGGALTLIDGHLRKADYDVEWPTLILDVNDAEADVLLATLDPLSALAGRDQEKLDELLARVRGDSVAVQQTWGQKQSDSREDHPEVISRADELQAKWQVERGQVWLCGKHRVMCGDSTSADDVARLMAGKKADALLTDPPYGMNLDTDWSGIRGSDQSLGFKKNVRGKAYPRVQGDDKPFDPCPILDLWAANAPEVFLFGADYYAERIPERTEGSWLVWDKRKESQAEGFGSEFELIWSRQKHKRRILRHEWFGFLREGEHSEPRSHPTQKPVVLIEDIVHQWCNGELIVDPFLGSGTTLIAAEKLGRICYGMEIHPPYVAVVLERYLEFTGDMPSLVNGN